MNTSAYYSKWNLHGERLACRIAARAAIALRSCLLAVFLPISGAGQDGSQDLPPGPIVESFSPATGPVGSEVVIEGQNFGGTSLITFNGVAADFRPGILESSLIATVPLAASTGPISVTTPSGTFTTVMPFTVTATPAPVISGFTPDAGPIGTRVLINGTNFIAVTAVLFNGVSAEFTSLGDSISAAVPAGAMSGPITVVASGGTAGSSASFSVTTASAPVITGVDPAEGSSGTTVTVAGRNLEAATSVSFNGTPAAFNAFGGSLFTIVPDGAVSGPITVTTPNGSATSPTPFRVLDPLAPQVLSFTPEVGEPGAAVTITGANLQITSEVRIGGAAAQFTLISDSELRVVVPAGATTGPIVVTTPRGTAVSGAAFYVPANIQTFEPTHGGAGTVVRITGMNFTDALAVLFGGANAQFTVISSAEIRATVPADAVSGPVSVATPAGFANSSTAFLLPPKVNEFTPASGPAGDSIAVSGENFLGTTSVRFGDREAAFTVVAPTAILATVPVGAANGVITVTSPAGSASSQDIFFVGSFGDLGVFAEPSTNLVSPGEFLRYTITVTNRGPLEASNVVLTDRLPPGVQSLFAPSGADCTETNNVIICRTLSLPPGGGITVRLTVTVISGPYLTNQVTVTSSVPDPNLTDNSAVSVIPLAGSPPPEITLSAARSGQGIALSWPVPDDGYVLESSSRLGVGATWSSIPGSGEVVNGRRRVNVPVSGATGYYRLHRP